MLQLQSDVHRDLIILNIPHSQSDNFELLEHISTSSVLNDICRVVISDSDDEQLKHKTVELGASLFIKKPFDPVFLSDKVRELIDMNESPLDKKRRFSFNMNIF
jgi:response regulator RpfG family c-di-GMP phosphodiesterase